MFSRVFFSVKKTTHWLKMKKWQIDSYEQHCTRESMRLAWENSVPSHLCLPVRFLLNTLCTACALPLTLYNQFSYKTMTGTVVRAYVTANRQRMWGWVADAILVCAGITGWTVRQPGGAVMVSVSWGSKGEVNATRPCFCVSGRQERHRKGRGGQWGGGDEDMERVKGNWWECWLLHTYLYTPAWRHTRTHTYQSGQQDTISDTSSDIF